MMAGIRGRNTKPEIVVRKMLFAKVTGFASTRESAIQGRTSSYQNGNYVFLFTVVFGINTLTVNMLQSQKPIQISGIENLLIVLSVTCVIQKI